MSGAGPPDSSTLLSQVLQVGGEPRGQVGVGGRRGEPLVLAELGQDLAAEGDVHVGERLAQRLADPPFVFGVREGEEQADGDRLYLRLFHGGDGGSSGSPSSSGASSPSGPILSCTVKRRSRGTRAGGRSCARS